MDADPGSRNFNINYVIHGKKSACGRYFGAA